MWVPHTILRLPTLFHSSPHLNTLPYTLHTNPIHSSTPLPPPNTLHHFFHILIYLTPLLKLPKISQFFHHPYSPKFSTLPRFFPILSHAYFIIYLILKFLTFLIYCLISLAIKYSNSSDGRVVQSVCLLSCRLRFDSESGQTNDSLKLVFAAFLLDAQY